MVISEKSILNIFYVLIPLFIISLYYKSAISLIILIAPFIILFKIYLLIAVLLISSLIYYSSKEYFDVRFLIDGECNSNLSNIVFLRGFDIFKNAFSHFGYGFQSSGAMNFPSKFDECILALDPNVNNFYDNGFLFAKISNEFGIFTIFFLLIIFALFFKIMPEFLSNQAKPQSSKTIFFNSLAITSLIYLFLKGNGYFTASFFLIISSIYFKLVK
jgi:hypothetical protein